MRNATLVIRFTHAVVIIGTVLVCGTSWPATQQVAGVTVDEAGTPVPGATIQLWNPIKELCLEMELAPGGSVETDKDGRFSLSVDDERVHLKEALLTVQHPKYGLGWTPAAYLVRRQKDFADLNLVLHPRGAVRGKVTDPNGAPVTDAVVTALIALTAENDMDLKFMVAHDLILKATTGSDGTFILDGLPKEATVMLRTTHPGLATTTAGAPEEPAGPPIGTIAVGAKDVAIQMARAASASGRVTFEGTGKPAEGAVVEAVPSGRDQVALVRGAQRAKTGADGRYTLGELAIGTEYEVHVVYSDGLAEWKKIKVDDAGPLDGQDFTLGKGVLVSGRFVEAETGKPVPDGHVEVGRKGVSFGLRPVSAQTQPDGTFEVRAAPGEVVLYAHADSGDIPREQAERELTLVAGQDQTNIEFKTEPPLTFKGKVVDSKGKALAGAEVRVKREYGSIRRSVKADTDKRGQFELSLPGQQVGQYEFVALEATHPQMTGYRGVLMTALVERSDAEGTIKMKRVGAIRGRVVDEQGKPIPGAKVAASLVFERPEGGATWQTLDRRLETDVNGRFDVATAVSGVKYSVEASADNFGRRQSEVPSVPENGAYEVPDAVLPVADQIVEGTVTDEDGNPVSGVRLNCYGSTQPERNTTTDAQGRFRLDKIVAGELYISANRQGAQGGYEYGNVRAEGGDTGIEIVLQGQGPGMSADDVKAMRLAGKPAPALDVAEWVKGAPVTLESLRGKTVVLAFWDSAQENSQGFVKAVNQFADKNARPGVAVVGIHSGVFSAAQPQKTNADRVAVQQAISKQGVRFPVALDKTGGAGNLGATFAAYKVKKAPAVFVIDAEGKVQFQDIALPAIEQALATVGKTK
jgi:protocatechuate 3,4-dioxygenase beta subunit/peroxiredoxin